MADKKHKGGKGDKRTKKHVSDSKHVKGKEVSQEKIDKRRKDIKSDNSGKKPAEIPPRTKPKGNK